MKKEQNPHQPQEHGRTLPPEIEPLSDAALEEVAGGAAGDPTGSPLCGPPDSL